MAGTAACEGRCSGAAASAEASARRGRRWMLVARALVESARSFGETHYSGAHMMSDPRLNPPLKELLNDISMDVRLLASQTLGLARFELATTVSTLMWAAVGVVVSALVAIAGLGVLVSALVLILIAIGLPPWAAATAVAVMLIVSGAVAARYFVGLVHGAELGMKETRESLRETIEWLKSIKRASSVTASTVL